VMMEGPFGVFTSAAMRTEKALLIAGGIGITPLRALFEEMAGSTDVVLIYRVVSKREFALRDELEEIAARWGATLHLLPGDHRRREAAKLLAPASLRSLVGDIAERDVYVCGPPAMMEQVAASLAELNVPEDQIHSERFALAP
jgi:ferredoxin-NADP reductase